MLSGEDLDHLRHPKHRCSAYKTKMSDGVKEHIEIVYMQQGDEHYISKDLALYCLIFHGMSTLVCEFSLFLC